MSKRSSGLSLDKYLYDDLFLFGTSATQKPADMSFISKAQREEYGLSFGFHPLDEWAPYHAAVEDGMNGHDNNILKAKEAADAFDHLRPGHSLHDSLLTRLKKEKLVQFDPDRPGPTMKHVWLLTEDTTSSMPLDIWRRAAELIEPDVDPRLIYADVQAKIIKGEKNEKGEDTTTTIKGKKYVVIPDIGPLLKSAGPHPFFEAVRQAASELGYEDIPYIIHCDCAATRLSDSKQDSFFKFQSSKELRVFLPNGIHEPIPKSENLITTSDDYLSLPESPHQPLSADLGTYIKNESPRRLVLDKIAARLQNLRSRETSNVLKFPSAARAAITNPPEKPRVKDRQLKIVALSAISSGSEKGVSSGWNLKRIDDSSTLKFKIAEPNVESLMDTLNMEFPFKSSKKLRHPDVVVLPPFDPRDPAQRIYAAANFTKATTAKQIDPRLYPVPIFVMNLNGCYDELMALHRGYISLGYCSDYERHLFYDGYSAAHPVVTVKGVAHRATGMLDELAGTHEADLYRALMEVKDVRLENYARRHIKPVPDGELKCEEYPEIFGVGYFSSATSQKRQSLETAAEYGEFLAKEQIALYTGGGDKDLMYAPVEPFVRNNGPYLGVFSTFGLVTKETVRGYLLPAHMARLTRGIGPRIMEGLLPWPNQFTSWPGGRGTGEEDTTVLSLKLFRSPLVENKKFYYMEPFVGRNPETTSIQQLKIDAFHGPGTYKKMLADHDYLAEQDVFLETEVSKLKRETLKNRDAFYAQNGQSTKRQAGFHHS